MLAFSYISILVVSIIGLLVIDYQYKLAFFYDKTAAIVTIACSVLLFTIWDVLGIYFGVFFTGPSKYTIDLLLIPEFPIEEVFFLVLLSYVTLILYRIFERKLWLPT